MYAEEKEITPQQTNEQLVDTFLERFAEILLMQLEQKSFQNSGTEKIV